MKWKDKLIEYLIKELRGDAKWGLIIEKIALDDNRGIHLAIFNEPFLSLVINGKKKIESRFSVNRVGPYDKILKDDIVLVKESGGPIVGIFLAGDVMFLSNLDSKSKLEIERTCGKEICTEYDPKFWENRAKANYGTLIEIRKFKKLKPFESGKRDRSGWSILRRSVSMNFS